eukprot:COSAG02_NODE_49950_length_323_cov_1.276786_1_plen_107_part_11
MVAQLEHIVIKRMQNQAPSKTPRNTAPAVFKWDIASANLALPLLCACCKRLGVGKIDWAAMDTETHDSTCGDIRDTRVPGNGSGLFFCNECWGHTGVGGDESTKGRP